MFAFELHQLEALFQRLALDQLVRTQARKRTTKSEGRPLRETISPITSHPSQVSFVERWVPWLARVGPSISNCCNGAPASDEFEAASKVVQF